MVMAEKDLVVKLEVPNVMAAEEETPVILIIMVLLVAAIMNKVVMVEGEDRVMVEKTEQKDEGKERATTVVEIEEGEVKKTGRPCHPLATNPPRQPLHTLSKVDLEAKDLSNT